MLVIEDFVDGMEKDLREVFYSSVRLCCVQDYTKEQLEAWAPDVYDSKKWAERIKGIRPFVARLDGKVVGYTNLQKNGYIDHFFVHGTFQGCGIGAALMSKIFSQSTELSSMHSQVSITARPFFMRYGFEIIHAQEVQIKNVKLTNYFMQYRFKTLKNRRF